MTPAALWDLVRFYQNHLAGMQIEPVRYGDRRAGIGTDTAQLDHVLWMLGQLDGMAKGIAGLIAVLGLPVDGAPTDAGLDQALALRLKELRAQRWLGFVQGALWSQGIFTTDELRAHVSPGKEES